MKDMTRREMPIRSTARQWRHRKAFQRSKANRPGTAEYLIRRQPFGCSAGGVRKAHAVCSLTLP
jgi:hypothetical protein